LKFLSKPLAAFATLAALLGGAVWSVQAIELAHPNLNVRLDGEYLRLTAPHLNFLTGKALDRLRSGLSVAYVGQISVTPGPASVVADARTVVRFALSYDIWEERFSVTRFAESPELTRTISHLSSQAAESWCLDNLTIPKSRVPAERPFYVQLDLRAEDPKEPAGIVGEPGINLSRLIQIFSSPAKGAQPHWTRSDGPFRMAELRKGSHS
jgi:hypothetical protein